MDIDLDWYPELKEALGNVFDMKVSLVDLARQLEKDLVIYEHEPTRFKLDFKTTVFDKQNKFVFPDRDSPPTVDRIELVEETHVRAYNNTEDYAANEASFYGYTSEDRKTPEMGLQCSAEVTGELVERSGSDEFAFFFPPDHKS